MKKIKDWYYLPFIIILAMPLLIDALSKTGSKRYIAFIFTLIIPLVLRRVLNIKPFNFILFSFPILILAIIFDLQILEYNTFINPSTWFTLSDTYSEESYEFLLSTDLLTRIVVLFQITVYFLYLFFTYKKTNINTTKKIKILSFSLLAFFIIDYSVKGATSYAFPVRGFESLYNYYKTKATEKKYIDKKKKMLFNAKRTDEFKDSNSETIVIVVGESLRRDHLAYYGYNKPTTPILDQEDLIIFSDVISPANQTINSLKRCFTAASYLDEDDYWKQPSFIKAFKEVGFETYWVTTQPVYGKHSSEASFIGEETDHFIDHKHGKYDIRLIKSYIDVLNDSPKKKLIFIHILDTHAVYKFRYPKENNIFAKNTNIDERKLLINQYDNAVRYNDLFLSKILSNLKKINGEKSFIMFSDHGESLFDTPNRAGHGSANPSQSEYNVPLITWFSDEFKKNHLLDVTQLEKNKDLPIILSDMFHAFPTFYGIEFKKIIKENCFLNNTYKPKFNRKVVNVNLELLDYNKLIKSSENSNN